MLLLLLVAAVPTFFVAGLLAFASCLASAVPTFLLAGLPVASCLASAVPTFFLAGLPVASLAAAHSSFAAGCLVAAFFS